MKGQASAPEKVGMTLLARCTGKHFLLLTGKERLLFEPHLVEGAPLPARMVA